MRVIPVLDVSRGRAVHARAGEREHYQPVRSILHEGSDAIELAGAFRDHLGSREIYVADLDAIAGAEPALPVYRQIVALGLDVWVDAGVRGAVNVAPLLDAGIHVVVVGLETIAGRSSLKEILGGFDRTRIAFSLDLRAGEPLCAPGSDWSRQGTSSIASTAIALGVRRLIALDLANVGMGTGVGTLELISGIAKDHPTIEIVSGGGVAGIADLVKLGRAGASAALVASALHDGRLTREDLDRLADPLND